MGVIHGPLLGRRTYIGEVFKKVFRDIFLIMTDKGNSFRYNMRRKCVKDSVFGL
jgi:hypothetical protein